MKERRMIESTEEKESTKNFLIPNKKIFFESNYYNFDKKNYHTYSLSKNFHIFLLPPKKPSYNYNDERRTLLIK